MRTLMMTLIGENLYKLVKILSRSYCVFFEGSEEAV